MKVLFDQRTPVPLRPFLLGHDVATAYEMGWAGLKNGELLAIAETQFDGLITTDQNLRYPQNLSQRNLRILVLPTTSWPKLRRATAKVLTALNELPSGGYLELILDSSD